MKSLITNSERKLSKYHLNLRTYRVMFDDNFESGQQPLCQSSLCFQQILMIQILLIILMGMNMQAKPFFLLCRPKEAIHIFFSQASTAFIKHLLRSFFAALGFKQKFFRYTLLKNVDIYTNMFLDYHSEKSLNQNDN